MDIIYSDSHLLVVKKPCGLATQIHEGIEGLEDLAKEWVKKEFNKPGNVFLEPIHRLDKPVSGIVLFARTSKALSRLQAMMREKTIFKTYTALVEGIPPETEGSLTNYVVHDAFRARSVAADYPEAKIALLDYRVIGNRGSNTLVEIKLHTGRYHQIRLQFSLIGCPVVGDQKYGSRSTYRENEIALHHGKLELIHPVKKEPLVFVSAPPQSMLKYYT